MNLLSAENLSKSYGERVLFSGLTFGINQGQKVALIARNGTGKSTLLNILAGKDAPDSGQVTCRKGLRVAYLEQDPLPGGFDLAIECKVGIYARALFQKVAGSLNEAGRLAIVDELLPASQVPSVDRLRYALHNALRDYAPTSNGGGSWLERLGLARRQETARPETISASLAIGAARANRAPNRIFPATVKWGKRLKC